jgi:protein-S-isoprenylcysteine O-methyltransferase Ste14
MKSENPKRKDNSGLLLPRKVVPLVWAIIVLVIMVVLPWAISKIGLRIGWSQKNPAWWNFTGLIAVAIGLGFYAWCLVFHYLSYRASVRVSFSPPRLVINGPYRISRNPMYVSGLFTWFGWIIFYGSPAVIVAFLILWSVFTFRVIPHEERQLESLFGEEYLKYKHSVHRWIGRY